MASIIGKIRENAAERIVEVFWVAVKAAIVTTIILLLLRIIPVTVQHGTVRVTQRSFADIWSVGIVD